MNREKLTALGLAVAVTPDHEFDYNTLGVDCQSWDDYWYFAPCGCAIRVAAKHGDFSHIDFKGSDLRTLLVETYNISLRDANWLFNFDSNLLDATGSVGKAEFARRLERLLSREEGKP